jgi:hypothetical protein
MTVEEKAELIALCERITVEKDPQIFHALIIQLYDFVERKDHSDTLPICPICGKPCPLEDCVVNSKGTAIHKECYRVALMSEKELL